MMHVGFTVKNGHAPMALKFIALQASQVRPEFSYHRREMSPRADGTLHDDASDIRSPGMVPAERG